MLAVPSLAVTLGAFTQGLVVGAPLMRRLARDGQLLGNAGAAVFAERHLPLGGDRIARRRQHRRARQAAGTDQQDWNLLVLRRQLPEPENSAVPSRYQSYL